MDLRAYFEQAELALAAYADLSNGRPNESALTEAGMSENQAKAFADNWLVVDQFNDPITGVSSTVFQKIGSDEKYLAIRGTQGSTDYLADYFILPGVPSGMNPQYQSLKTQLQLWLNDPNVLKDETFTVSGHSLGGYLAAGLLADFGSSISHAYLYNAPGNNAPISLIMQALGIIDSPNSAKITSLRADAGLSPIADLGYDFSEAIPITIENQLDPAVLHSAPLALNHSQQVLTDALAVYCLFAEMSPNLTIEDISGIIRAVHTRQTWRLKQRCRNLPISSSLMSQGSQVEIARSCMPLSRHCQPLNMTTQIYKSTLLPASRNRLA